MPPKPPASRESIPIATKGALVREWERTNKKAHHRDLALKFGIKDRSSVSRILKDAEKWKQLSNTADATAKHVAHVEHPVLEACLTRWINMMLAFKDPHFALTGNIIKQKALDFGKELGISEDDFKASEGWLQKYKNRLGLKLRVMAGEAGAAPLGSLAQERRELQELLEKYEPCNVYNADESPQYTKMPPRKGLLKGKQSGGKKELTRWTALFLCNADGSDMDKVFVIGKSKTPQPFKRTQNLRHHHHVSYTNNATAWMNMASWTDWLQELDKRMIREKREILLLVDNFSGHKTTEGWKPTKVKVHYLPPNTTAHLQPLDAGIIAAYKRKYSALLSKHWVATLDRLCSVQGPQPDPKDIKLAKLVNAEMVFAWIHTAWNGISKKTIINCWKHTGITPAKWWPENVVLGPMTREAAEEREEVAQILTMLSNPQVIDQCGDSMTVDDYLRMESQVQQLEMETDAEIVQRVQGQEGSNGEDEDDEEDTLGTSELLKVDSEQEIIRCLEKLKLWATYKGGEVGAAASRSLVLLEREARRLDMEGRTQAPITAYYKPTTQQAPASTSTPSMGGTSFQPIVIDGDDGLNAAE